METPSNGLARHKGSLAVIVALVSFCAFGAAETASAAKVKKDSVTSKSVKDNSLKGKDIKDNSITGADINEASLTLSGATGAAGGDLTGNYPNPQIAPSVVGAAELANNSVTSVKIVDGSIVTDDLADAAVTTAKLANDAVTSAQVLNETLGASDLGTDSVQASEIADDTIDQGEIINGGVGAAEVAATQVVTADSAVVANGGVAGATATCPAGTQMISGGADGGGSGTAWRVQRSIPFGNGWRAFGTNETGGNSSLQASVVCLNP